MNAKICDPRALQVAEAVHHREHPQATILFGSRARGDYEELRSDIDIMLVLPEEPGKEHKESVAQWVQETALAAYGRRVPVQVVWFASADFNENRRYINHVTTQALLDGVVMSGNPEEFLSRYSDDQQTEYEYQWTDYHNRLYHAESHLEAFEVLDSTVVIIAQQAHSALEHAMKAVIAGHGGTAERPHDLGRLLGAVRRIDPSMNNFRLSIPPDIYSEYAGDNEYERERTQPLLTAQDDYRERTVNDIRALIEQAHELGPTMYN